MPQLRTRIKRLPWPRYFATLLYPPPASKLSCWAGEYKYRIIGAPTSYDPVMAVICRKIKALAKQDMYIAGAKIQVHQLSHGPNIWPLSLENAGCPVKLYAFQEMGEEFPITVPVSIVDRGSDRVLTAERILVEIGGKWKPLEMWLGEWIVPECVTRTSHHAYMAQRRWWDVNGKTFRLLDLPGELRSRVLRHVLGEVMRPATIYTNGQVRVVLGYFRNRVKRGYLDDFQYKRALFWLDQPNFAIFRVSKQVHREAWHAAWIGSVKNFTHWIELFDVLEEAAQPPVLTHLNTSPTTLWLAKIRLDFSLNKYFRFFGISASPTLHIISTRPVATVLRTIPTLTHLDLFFNSPYDSAYAAKNPWTQWIKDGNSSSRDDVEFPCYAKVIDWLLLFSFPHIKHVPHPSFSGAIKTRTRAKWMECLKQARDGRRQNQCVDDVPECACPKSCSPYAIPWGEREFDHDDVYVPRGDEVVLGREGHDRGAVE